LDILHFFANDTNDIRNQLHNIVEIMRSENPFYDLSHKDADLLKSIDSTLKSNNNDLGRTILRQLASEIAIKDSNLKIQEKRNKVSTIVSIVGVILTLFFGVISVVLFFSTPTL